MNDDPAPEVARSVTLVAEEAGLIRDLAATAGRLLEVMDARRQLRAVSSSQWRTALPRRTKAGRS